MVRALIVLSAIALVLMLWSFFDVMQTARPRTGSKGLWVAAVLLLPVLGPVGWIAYGRPRRTKRPPRRGIAPDDDPDFLRGL
ncbi:MAG: hypothetical protein EB027_05115 [Actinobacteria bacterium]|nr:hypothetical protein [Actinomycetota bacterium]